jgi:NDP-sugar pyrophosphorylase family protein
MQIVIPMSGFGERFRRAGYRVPKPLIEIEGKPVIAHVIDLFPSENDFLFICNQEHLDEPSYRMQEILEHFCPSGKIVGIAPHKLGPVHAVLQVEKLIKPDRAVVVNYCDFTCYWDWRHFKHFVVDSGCVGAIPAYKGFHPHTLGTTNYAYMREFNGWIIDIQEKQPYTSNRMEEYASSGTYYFATGQIMLDAFRKTIEQNLNVNGEFYVSLAYKPLLADNCPIAVYDLQHFMQWGTPQDVAEYCAWSEVFRRLTEKPEVGLPAMGAVVVPMAGLGERFLRDGYTQTKPLIPVSGKPMVLQAAHDLPSARHYVFVVRENMPGATELVHVLENAFPGALIRWLSAVTEGQACTAAMGVDTLLQGVPDFEGPITIGACDNGALYDKHAFGVLIDDTETDVIVWAVRGHPNAIRHPAMYGWIEENEGLITSVSVKRPLAFPEHDPIILGTFSFKRVSDFLRCYERMHTRDARVNGEFYLDTCLNDAIALGLRCKIFEVEHYLSWGTPNDLRTFEYWQSCFHKWPIHPYRLELDKRLEPTALRRLDERYARTVPHLIGPKR